MNLRLCFSIKNNVCRKAFLFLFLFVVSFISWNYCGILFFVYGIYLFKHINEYEKFFNQYLIDSIILIGSWEVGSLFWMFHIDNGAYGILIHFLFTLAVIISFYFLRFKNEIINSIAFIIIWVFYELLQNLIPISFPWLIIGNVFSNQIWMIQWYEYTSVIGGSIWFLICSCFIYFILKKRMKTHLLLVIFILPVLFSINTYKNKKYYKKGKNKILIYNPEYNINKKPENFELSFELSKKIQELQDIDILITPELTFEMLNIKEFRNSLTSQFLLKLLDKDSIRDIYIGSSLYDSDNKNRLINGLIYLTKNDLLFKFKKKLVPFNEYLPEPFTFLFNKSFYNYRYNDDELDIANKSEITPFICYEIFYPFFVSRRTSSYSRVLLISSEQFLNNSTLGRRQYNNIIKLRCIENRVKMIKASGFGDSLIIDHYGEIIKKSRDEFNIFYF